MKNDLISVVVPVYNVEKYLPKCIESIINQTYKNLEIILVDDGSPDECGRICDEYAAKDKRIKVMHKENGGLSDARNKGIDVATGTYLAFIDSDDYIDKEMFDKLYKRIIADGSDIAICNLLYVDDDENSIDKFNHDMPIKDECLTKQEIFEKFLEYKSWYYVTACNKLYKKSLFDETRFPVGKQHEDEFVVHRIFGQCSLISCVADAMYYYIQRIESIMGNGYSYKSLDKIEAYTDRANFMVSLGEYYIAKVFINAALSDFFKGKQNLDIKIPLNKKRFEELEQQFDELYSNIRKSKIPIQTKILLTIFMFNQSICQRIFEIKRKKEK